MMEVLVLNRKNKTQRTLSGYDWTVIEISNSGHSSQTYKRYFSYFRLIAEFLFEAVRYLLRAILLLLMCYFSQAHTSNLLCNITLTTKYFSL